jgi:hypothetical protein
LLEVRYRIGLTLVIALLAAGGARADVRARIVATDPAGDVIELARDQSLYLRIEYATDRPVSIWARPYFEGKEVAAKSNASIPHDGTGEALGWFAFNQPAEVDEIRIVAGDGSHAGTRQVASYPVKVIGTDRPATRLARAAWVDDLSRQEELVRRADYERRMSEPVTTGESLLMSGFMLGVVALTVGGLAWPAWGLWKWRGGWRAASAVPLLLMGFVVLRIVFDTARDPTSHNLWPFEILIWGIPCILIMLALRIARHFARPT